MSSNNGDQRSLHVLHVASFSGNIGDNANHMGFRPWFEDQVGRPVEWTNLEIREFYWKERQWDDNFVSLANSFDLLIIGGGNYFELWVENSPTGTSIAIEPATFQDIRVPVFFNALGVDPGQGVPDASLENFRSFLDTLIADSQYLVTVRNDGALGNLRKYLGEACGDAVHRIPDGGFFCPAPQPLEKDPVRRRIGINLASDMPEVRFAGFQEDDSVEAFACEFAKAINDVAAQRPDVDFVLVPHIFRDIDVTSRVIGHLTDRLRRTRVSVAGYGSGDAAAMSTLAVYASCDLVLAMRFHANVCPIGLGIQTLGLACYPQITNLYLELGQTDRLVDVSQPGFSVTLAKTIAQALSRPGSFSGSPVDAKASVTDLRSAFDPALRAWIEANELDA